MKFNISKPIIWWGKQILSNKIDGEVKCFTYGLLNKKRQTARYLCVQVRVDCRPTIIYNMAENALEEILFGKFVNHPSIASEKSKKVIKQSSVVSFVAYCELL